MQDSGRSCRGNAEVCPIVIASEGKQSIVPHAEVWIAHMGNVCVKDEQHLFVRLRPTSSSRPWAAQDDARRSSQGRPLRAAAQRLGLELNEHVIMLGRSGTAGAFGVGGSVRASAILAFAIQGSSRFGDLGCCLPDQTHIRSSREATAPGFRLRRAGSRGRGHSSLRRLKPCNPSVRPPGSSAADRASADRLRSFRCGRRSLPLGAVAGQAVGFITAPSMTTPWVTNFHRATRSLRASATIARLRPCWLRSLNQRVKADCGW